MEGLGRRGKGWGVGLAVCVLVLRGGGWEEGVAGCEGGVGVVGGVEGPRGGGAFGGVSAVREGGWCRGGL